MSLAPDVIAAAQRAQARRGIPASVLLAQYGDESAWGRRMPPGSNNPFGEKAVQGQAAVTVATHEVVRGQTVTVQAPFRRYASLDDAFDQHAEHLATSALYAGARARLPNVEAFCEALTGVYATDPAYGDKLTAIIRGDDLTRYDAPPVLGAQTLA